MMITALESLQGYDGMTPVLVSFFSEGVAVQPPHPSPPTNLDIRVRQMGYRGYLQESLSKKIKKRFFVFCSRMI